VKSKDVHLKVKMSQNAYISMQLEKFSFPFNSISIPPITTTRNQSEIATEKKSHI
jgi:hypothetical protein